VNNWIFDDDLTSTYTLSSGTQSCPLAWFSCWKQAKVSICSSCQIASIWLLAGKNFAPNKCRFSEQLNLWWWLDIHLHIVFWYSVLPSCLIFLLETGKGYYLFFLSDSINLIASSKEFRTKSWARSFGYRKVSWFFSFSHTVTTLPCLCYFLHEDNK